MRDQSSSTPGKALLPTWFLWFIVLCLIGGVFVAYKYSGYRKNMLKDAHNIPPIKQVPAFSLTDQQGHTVEMKDLLGEVWLADFIYTRCPGPCVALTKTVAGYQERLKSIPEVKIVSFTVDPEHDTPEVLAEYANRFGAEPGRWLFLTGTKDRMLSLIIKGFMLPVVENQPEMGKNEDLFIHSTRVALIDKRGMIRGYYDTESPEAVEKLFEDIPFLRQLEEK